jgi:hypothetical protein
MIEKIANLPGNIVGMLAKGRITGDDYEKVIVPALDEAAKKYAKIRFLYILGEDFDGITAEAMWDDVKVGLRHIRDFEKMAVVTDNKMIREAIRVFGFVMPAEVRVFGNLAEKEARDWILK